MKRLDRAMYAFFLLALLADLARAQVPASFGGDAAAGFAGGSIQSVPRQIRGQIRVSPAGEVVLVSRRSAAGSNRSARLVLPVARSKASSFALSSWARILSAQTRQSTPVMLAALSSRSETGCGALPSPDVRAESSYCTVFEHSGSPAP